MLITDPTFAAGVVSQKNHVHGTLKGQGHAECLVDYVQNEEHVDIGEWFYTSGDDRIFPKGFPVGQVTAAPNGKTFKEIYVSPSGMQGGVEEVLIVLQGVHQEIPGEGTASPAYTILPAPSEITQTPEGGPQPGTLATDADRLRAIYKQVGEEEKHTYGEGVPGSKPPDFTKIPSIHGVVPNGVVPNGVVPNGVVRNGVVASGTVPKDAVPNGAPANSALPKGVPVPGAAGIRADAPAQPGQARTAASKPPATALVKPKPQPPASDDGIDDEPAALEQRKVAPPAASINPPDNQ
jgi:rod shape-determining protein MreC